MKIIYFSKKDGRTKVVPETLDDLYYLSKLAMHGDLASAITTRKIQLGGREEKQRAIRKPALVKIELTKVELDYSSKVLRLSGKVLEGSEEFPRGVSHTLSIGPKDMLTLEKNKWKK